MPIWLAFQGAWATVFAGREASPSQQVFTRRVMTFRRTGQVGKPIAFDVVTGQETIRYIKAWIHAFAGLPVQFQLLTYQGVPMNDKLTLADYGVPPGAVLKLRLQLWPGPWHSV